MNRHARPGTAAIPATPQLLFVSGWLLAATIALIAAAQFS